MRDNFRVLVGECRGLASSNEGVGWAISEECAGVAATSVAKERLRLQCYGIAKTNGLNE